MGGEFIEPGGIKSLNYHWSIWPTRYQSSPLCMCCPMRYTHRLRITLKNPFAFTVNLLNMILYVYDVLVILFICFKFISSPTILKDSFGSDFYRSHVVKLQFILMSKGPSVPFFPSLDKDVRDRLLSFVWISPLSLKGNRYYDDIVNEQLFYSKGPVVSSDPDKNIEWLLCLRKTQGL